MAAQATEGMTATEMIGSGQAPADTVVDKVLDAGAKALEQQEREENGMTTKGGVAAAAMVSVPSSVSTKILFILWWTSQLTEPTCSLWLARSTRT